MGDPKMGLWVGILAGAADGPAMQPLRAERA